MNVIVPVGAAPDPLIVAVSIAVEPDTVGFVVKLRLTGGGGGPPPPPGGGVVVVTTKTSGEPVTVADV